MYIDMQWRPAWSRRDHPLVRPYLRKPLALRFGVFIVLSAVLLFLLFGSLSLPMLYFLFSFVVLLHIAVNTGDKIHVAREAFTWDLLHLTPFSRREVLLSLWAASLWQISLTWIMLFYRLLHGVVMVGVIVFSLILTEIPVGQWFLILLGGTLVLIFQPFADMFYSGMVGLFSAKLTHDRITAQGMAVGGVIVYWLAWLGLTGVIVLSVTGTLSLEQILLLLLIPLALPLSLGYLTFRITERLP